MEPGDAGGSYGRLADQGFWDGFDGDVVRNLFDKVAGYPAPSPLPAGFAEEVIDPARFGEADVFAEEGVVGAFWEEKPHQVPEAIDADLDAHGWGRVGVDGAGSTYVKAAGDYRWLHVSLYETPCSATAVFAFERGG